MKMTRHDIEQINQIAAIIARQGQTPDPGCVRLSRHDKERGTMIREWGRMARSGLGLWYGRCTLDDGRRDESLRELSAEEYDLVHAAVIRLPSLNMSVICCLYRDRLSAADVGIRLGLPRGTVDGYRDEALSMLYGALCTRITVPA